MGLNDMLGKTLGAVKVISEKASESEKSVSDFVASLKNSANDLIEAKDKLETKLAKFEAEFGDIKTKIGYYESKMKKTYTAALVVIGMNFFLLFLILAAIFTVR